MNIKKFKVGETVYIRDYGYRSNEASATMKEATVTKVTNKYVTVKTGSFDTEYKFNDEQKRLYYLVERVTTGSGNKLFHTMQDYEDWVESDQLYVEIRSCFRNYYTNLTLDQIKRIKKIIEEDKEEC